ncbi:ROK family protein [Aeoliella mucimassa]|uniref:N-acetylmannosamine kinase n=1 Tax=Aeoliella mucimassa TaxID=2527972 RepID=A0A518AWL8_9BACT|nr:ROK family protein [Aeoliella mucimassa]QDU59132.1 N-acetylmannosamine kinase [Aeoliella mucimassa]
MSYLVGIDVGGTTSTVAIGNENCEILYVSDQFDTNSAAGPGPLIHAVVEAILKGLESLGGTGDEIAAVCIATPGPATLDGVLLKTPNLKAEYWDRFNIRLALENGLDGRGYHLDVQYIGDGQAAALGEYSVRSGKLTYSAMAAGTDIDPDLQSLFKVIVGTGLGGGEVRDGRVVRGREGRAGHAGHLLLPADAFRYEHDRELKVGNAFSTVESAVSLTALAHQLGYRLELEEWRDHPLNSQPGTVRDKAKRLRELAAAGDTLAQQLFDDQARALGIALLDINYLGDYDMIVIGGGVCDLAPEVRSRYLRLAEESYREHALDGFRNLEHFVFSACGDAAPVIGALANAYHSLEVAE